MSEPEQRRFRHNLKTDGVSEHNPVHCVVREMSATSSQLGPEILDRSGSKPERIDCCQSTLLLPQRFIVSKGSCLS
ncbi:unnamed protein product [Gongylonema pulchrum]|uniref:Uncharacterized protein n=1 Tax=Gongylonema pulchrum TaxID=637853 RepID=A0A3P6S0E7_9BILA|nr:unnamed protein product [Gongylonema pulchrum]